MTRHLPVELTTFVGRRKELAEGRRMVRAARLVTIVGPGGVGKTRLATRLAHQMVRVFPDGVVWVDLAAQRDPASVAGQVATALGVDPQDQSVEAALATYLRSRQLLLVLDNCEHLVDACARVSTSLLGEAPDMRVLATSRERLRVAGEHVMSVEPLVVPTHDEAAAGAVGHVEAVALLADRAQAIDPGFRVDAANAEAVSRLCRRLDGIPLAIELAVARLRMLSLHQVADRLDERFELLTAGARTALPRHQTLRGLVEWSHELCSAPERELWARLSVFDGGADLEAVHSVCGGAGDSTLELLAGLVDKSVVTVSESGSRVRFRMLETIREYGAERLAERAETDVVLARHRDHYVALAGAADGSWFGPDQPVWLARITDDLGNLRGALEHSLSQQADRFQALHLVTSMAWYWPLAGSMDEGMRWFGRALADLDDLTPDHLLALSAGANLANQRHDNPARKLLARRAALVPVTERTAADRAARHRARALLATANQEHDTSLAEHLLAAAEYDAAGDPAKQVEELVNAAIITAWLGRPADATPYVDTAMRVCHDRGERFVRSEVLCVYGDLLGQLGRHEEALQALRTSLAEAPTLRTYTVADVLELVSRSHAATVEKRRAVVLLGARGRIWRDYGFAPGSYLLGGYDTIEKRLTEALGEDAFRAAYEQGYAMSVEEAVQFALGAKAPTSAAPPAAGASQLSKRENQVAELVARGLSNKDIAQELVISQRTAEGHVAKVMEKLGVHSREQVAGWVTERRGSATW